jgi:hypothetical protein
LLPGFMQARLSTNYRWKRFHSKLRHYSHLQEGARCDGMRNVIFDGCNRRSKADLVRSHSTSGVASYIYKYKDTGYLTLQDTNPLPSFN